MVAQLPAQGFLLAAKNFKGLVFVTDARAGIDDSMAQAPLGSSSFFNTCIKVLARRGTHTSQAGRYRVAAFPCSKELKQVTKYGGGPFITAP